MRVLVRDSPRAVVLQSSGAADDVGGSRAAVPSSSTARALVLSASGNIDGRSTAAPKALIQNLAQEELDVHAMRPLAARPAFGCLGLMNIGQDLFAAVVTAAVEVGSISPGDVVMRIMSVSFYCLNRSTWDDVLVGEIAGASSDSGGDSYGNGGTTDPVYQQSIYEHPCAALKKHLSSGSFYFAQGSSFDLSTRLDRRARDPPPPGEALKSGTGATPTHDISRYDGRFVWNTYMIEPLMSYRDRLEQSDKAKLDTGGFFLLAIQGFVGIYQMPSHPLSAPGLPTAIALISRLSWKRAGTRFNTRGIDDDGNVANFVESETVFANDGALCSYVQVRGSVPLFWEQQGLQALNARIQITRPRAASQPAFDRHFAQLLSEYALVHALNLLGTRDAETVLGNAYAEHMRHNEAEKIAVLPNVEAEEKDEAAAEVERVGLTNFDFHAASRATGGIDGVRSEFGYLAPVQVRRKHFAYSVLCDGKIVRQQRGVFRTNCLDCLDRTNVVQDMLSQSALESFVDSAAAKRPSFEPFKSPTHALWQHHRILWAENGDALSKIYAGTGALNTNFTRTGKKTLGGLLSDAAKSAGRMYINNFQDKGKQLTVDTLLGNMANQRPVAVYDPVHDAMMEELWRRRDQYSSSHNITIFTGTFNLNGRPPGESLLPWLCPPELGDEEPDIVAVGFQEIVELTPQQILSTDPDKIRVWEAALVKTLAQRPGSQRSRYIQLRSIQQVGTALVLLVKEDALPHIRAVEATEKKTGLKGMGGNKGGVSVRLQWDDTTLAFVTAHFAAGHSAYEERNADYWTIARGLVFQRGKTLASHDHVFWFGDFNYRVELSNDVARPLAMQFDLAPLLQRDQLTRARESGAAFPAHSEGPLDFAPTYKYDVHSATYDSSEKQRVPAWTDRVLFRGEGLSLRAYQRAELRLSDHRPVYALFNAPVRIVDQQSKEALKRELLAKFRASDFVIPRHAHASSGSESGGEDLPEPSTDEHAWWDDVAERASSSDDEEEGSDWERAGRDDEGASTDEEPRGAVGRNTTIRRRPPPPPVAPKVSKGGGAEARTNPPAKAPPPPIPTKPPAVAAAGPPPSSPAPPPRRPGMVRTTSHTSTHSVKSLLDDSDDEK